MKYIIFIILQKIKEISKDLKFNSIYICKLILVKGDLVERNFAFMVPEKNIIFHRISKLNFFWKNYSVKNSHSIPGRNYIYIMIVLINYLFQK